MWEMFVFTSILIGSLLFFFGSIAVFGPATIKIGEHLSREAEEKVNKFFKKKG